MGEQEVWTSHCVSHDDPRLTTLLDAGFREFVLVYPELRGVRRGKLLPTAEFVLAGSAVEAPSAGISLGCCALQPAETDSGMEGFELKRLYVVPSARGSGVADTLIVAVEQAAKNHGAPQLFLETGDRYRAAIRCFERNGFRPIPPYPPYLDDPFARCYTKPLGSWTSSWPEAGKPAARSVRW